MERTPEAEQAMRELLALDPSYTPRENRKIRGGTPQPTASEAPSKPSRTSRGPKKESAAGSGYTLSQLCQELKLDPAEARKILRTSKVEKPGGKWEWPTPESAATVRKLLEGK